MALRKASAYSHRYARPYTRHSKKKGKNYIKAVPASKVVKMDMGDIKGFNEGKYSVIFRLVTTENVQIRDNALEAARQFIHKQLESNLVGQYCLMLKLHPHHVLRENKMLTGAGADRMSTGMSLSFGVTIGRAAMARAGQDIFVAAVNGDKGKKIARESFEKVRPKMPCACRIVVEERKAGAAAA
ncbi:50S ribosomal protein L16 [Candidatus Pacearchaeota archaeon]|nr:50S ribosomal protein L16 [Candidatus Pacearchaeota archaeon]